MCQAVTTIDLTMIDNFILWERHLLVAIHFSLHSRSHCRFQDVTQAKLKIMDLVDASIEPLQAYVACVLTINLLNRFYVTLSDLREHFSVNDEILLKVPHLMAILLDHARL